MRTRKEQEKIAEDWLKYAREWFDIGNSNAIDAYTDQLLKQMDEAWGWAEKDNGEKKQKEIRFDIVWNYITRLRRIEYGKTGGLLKEPIILLRCAYAAARCKVYGEALKLCKQAYPKLTANKHWHGVALWMLGTLEWLYANRHDQALQHWERCRAEDFKIEEKRNIDDKGKWYQDRIGEMEIAILRGSLCNTIPPLYDIIPLTEDEEQIQNLKNWIRCLRKIWSQYYNNTKRSDKLCQIIARLPDNIDPKNDIDTYPAIKELVQLQENQNDDYQQILHTMIEIALKIVEFGYYDTAHLLLSKVIWTHEKNYIYYLALWSLGCLEWFYAKTDVQKSRPKKAWEDSYNTLVRLISNMPDGDNKRWCKDQLSEMEKAINTRTI